MAFIKKCEFCMRIVLFRPLDSMGYCPSCSLRQAEWEKKAEETKRQKKEIESREWEKISNIPSHNIVISEHPCKRQTGYNPTNFSNITPKGKYVDVVIFDVQTTGLKPSHDRIIEIAAIKYSNGQPISKFHTYVNPECVIPEDAMTVNGISDEMVKGSPLIGEVISSFDEFIGSSILVAHNLEFDLKFIYYSGSQVLTTKRKYIDTLGQAQRIIKKSEELYGYSLSSLCEYYRIPLLERDPALSNAFATGRLFFELVSERQS
ncbi:MAG: 3'-5' exonuclease [Lachnospiraceae bacterium]|nr:3'-5' exonuclease [Lachnospiraceae bacterium]